MCNHKTARYVDRIPPTSHTTHKCLGLYFSVFVSYSTWVVHLWTITTKKSWFLGSIVSWMNYFSYFKMVNKNIIEWLTPYLVRKTKFHENKFSIIYTITDWLFDNSINFFMTCNNPFRICCIFCDRIPIGFAIFKF